MLENICVGRLYDLQLVEHLEHCERLVYECRDFVSRPQKLSLTFVIIQYEGRPESVVDALARVREQ